MRRLAVAMLLTAIGVKALAAAKGPACPRGVEPRLTGDAFVPVECSTATKPLAELPGAPAAALDQNVLKALAGSWEGVIASGLGRWAVLLQVRTRFFGRVDVVLKLKDLQFRERVEDRLALSPAKGKGVYDAELSTAALPEKKLSGTLRAGGVAPEDASAAAPGERQLDLLFTNGAAHRARWTRPGKDELRVRVLSAVPGAPIQPLELELRRSTKTEL